MSSLLEMVTPYIVGRDKVTYDDSEYGYLILSRDFREHHNTPDLYVINKPGVLAVSETYPVEYRGLGLIHELIEFSQPVLTELGCLGSLKKELVLAELQGLDMDRYMAFRLRFFSGLIDHYESKPENPVEKEWVRRMRHSLEYLQQKSQ